METFDEIMGAIIFAIVIVGAIGIGLGVIAIVGMVLLALAGPAINAMIHPSTELKVSAALLVAIFILAGILFVFGWVPE